MEVFSVKLTPLTHFSTVIEKFPTMNSNETTRLYSAAAAAAAGAVVVVILFAYSLGYHTQQENNIMF